MLNLPNVTLVLIETRQHDLGLMALQECERRVKFGDVIVLTDRPIMFLHQSRRVYLVEDWPDKLGWSRCFWTDLAPLLSTSHALNIQWDSWVVDTGMWHNDFLKYDYIGAPWWYKDGMNVGNGGFCLRSTKFIRFAREHRAEFPVTTALDDDLFCRKYRPKLQDYGFEWAPEALAFDFAFECVRPSPNSRHFGFHAAYNFEFGCEGNRTRVLERAKIMEKCDYMTKSNPYIWKGLLEKSPWLEVELGRAS